MKIRFSTLLMIACIISAKTFSQAVNVQDSLALVDLYNSTDGPGWMHHNNWLTTKPVSKWYGITVTGTRVTQVNLQYNRLTGTLPASLGNLTALDYLIIGGNKKLVGTIPPEIGNLINATSLFLSGNGLTGSIPSEIGNMTKLGQIVLSQNKLTGSIPSSIGNIGASLIYLDLSYNQLSGSIPVEIGNFINLQKLELSHNQLSGIVPAVITSLSLLNTISVSHNQLSGNIYSELGSLANLAVLDLSYNQFTGSIPPQLGNLTLLHTLILSRNQLTGNIPVELSKLSKLNYLQLNNNQLSGEIPTKFGNLLNLFALDLSHNKLSGPFPPSFSKLTQLYFINISHNKLQGQITDAIGKLQTLYTLIADHNHFNGEISGAIATLPLETLDLSYNRFRFSGMELVAQTFPSARYNNQKKLVIHQVGNVLSVSAGGTLSNNTYHWFKVGEAGSTSITGDSTFHPAQDGAYYVNVTNAVATQLTLYSDTIDYVAHAALALKTITSPSASGNVKAFTAYPNPVCDRLTVQTSGKATFTLTNGQGETILTKVIENTGNMDVSTVPSGVYYLTNTATGLTQKIVVNK